MDLLCFKPVGNPMMDIIGEIVEHDEESIVLKNTRALVYYDNDYHFLPLCLGNINAKVGLFWEDIFISYPPESIVHDKYIESTVGLRVSAVFGLENK